jgi:hypothetical protein
MQSSPRTRIDVSPEVRAFTVPRVEIPRVTVPSVSPSVRAFSIPRNAAPGTVYRFDGSGRDVIVRGQRGDSSIRLRSNVAPDAREVRVRRRVIDM